MEEIDTRLVEAERVKASWTPVQDLVIDSLSEHMDNLKVNAALKFIASLLPIAILKHIWMGRNHRSLFSCHRIFKSELRPCRTCLKRWAERRMNLGRRVCRSRQPCRAGLTSYTGVGNSCKFSFYRDSTHSKRLIPVLTWPLYQDSSVSSNGTHCKKQGLGFVGALQYFENMEDFSRPTQNYFFYYPLLSKHWNPHDCETGSSSHNVVNQDKNEGSDFHLINQWLNLPRRCELQELNNGHARWWISYV